MQAALINKLTWEDIKEIDSVLCSIDKEGKVLKTEDYYSEAIRRLNTKYKTLPACKERYKELLPVAENVTGQQNGKERTFEHTVLRSMIACRLKDEGYCLSDIARTLKYNHSTVLFYFKKKEDIFTLPYMYEREVRWFKAFDEALKDGIDGDN